MKYDLKKRIFLLKTYYEFKSIAIVQSKYRVEYNEKTAPNDSVIRNIVRSFEKTGSVVASLLKREIPSKKWEEAKIELQNLIEEMPSLSIRKASSALGVSLTLVFNILHDDLHLKPYKLKDWHKLEVHDYEKRVEFAQWFISRPPGYQVFIDLFWWSIFFFDISFKQTK